MGDLGGVAGTTKWGSAASFHFSDVTCCAGVATDSWTVGGSAGTVALASVETVHSADMPSLPPAAGRTAPAWPRPPGWSPSALLPER